MSNYQDVKTINSTFYCPQEVNEKLTQSRTGLQLLHDTLEAQRKVQMFNRNFHLIHYIVQIFFHVTIIYFYHYQIFYVISDSILRRRSNLKLMFSLVPFSIIKCLLILVFYDFKKVHYFLIFRINILSKLNN